MPHPRCIHIKTLQRVSGEAGLLLKYEVDHHLLEFIWFIKVYCTKAVKRQRPSEDAGHKTYPNVPYQEPSAASWGKTRQSSWQSPHRWSWKQRWYYDGDCEEGCVPTYGLWAPLTTNIRPSHLCPLPVEKGTLRPPIECFIKETGIWNFTVVREASAGSGSTRLASICSLNGKSCIEK